MCDYHEVHGKAKGPRRIRAGFAVHYNRWLSKRRSFPSHQWQKKAPIKGAIPLAPATLSPANRQTRIHFTHLPQDFRERTCPLRVVQCSGSGMPGLGLPTLPALAPFRQPTLPTSIVPGRIRGKEQSKPSCFLLAPVLLSPQYEPVLALPRAYPMYRCVFVSPFWHTRCAPSSFLCLLPIPYTTTALKLDTITPICLVSIAGSLDARI